MVRICTTIIAIMSILLLSSVSAAAEFGVDIRFSTDEVRLIRAYYEQHHGSSKPGKKKGRRGLPPGIARNLARGKPLPPGIAKQVLPGDLIGRLPPVHGGYERIIVDGKVLLVEIATQVVRDVLTDIILR
jgi:hypothetical protein